jgi:hypothetical protein
MLYVGILGIRVVEVLRAVLVVGMTQFGKKTA